MNLRVGIIIIVLCTFRFSKKLQLVISFCKWIVDSNIELVFETLC